MPSYGIMSEMKLSCLPVSFFDQIVSGSMAIGDWVRIGKRAGLDGIDLSVLFFDRKDASGGSAADSGEISRGIQNDVDAAGAGGMLNEIKTDIEAANLKLAMITSYPDFTNPDPSVRRHEIAKEKGYIQAAGLLGAVMIRVTSGQAHPGLQENDGIRWALEGLLACEETAREAGVTMVLENHGKPGCWQYTDFDQPTPIFLKLADGIKDTSIKINFDTANPLVYRDDPLTLLKEVRESVYSIHAADTSTIGELNHVLLGTGKVPFKEIFSYLKESDFNGWICMEENSRRGKAGVQKAAAFIRDAWRDA